MFSNPLKVEAKLESHENLRVPGIADRLVNRLILVPPPLDGHPQLNDLYIFLSQRIAHLGLCCHQFACEYCYVVHRLSQQRERILEMYGA